MNDNYATKSGTTKTSRINKMKTIDLVMTGMFTAIICVMSVITIPTQPIPFTLSLFAIFLTGALLSPRYALMATLAYLLIGAAGVPVFANMKGGLTVLTGMTGGYLMAYPLMAFITALFHKFIKKYKIAALACGMIISLVLCYLIGTLWFTQISNYNFSSALALCVYPYIPFDLIKIALAISISMVIRKTVYKGIGI